MLTPHHVAIIMDGNGRWAKKHGLPRIMGHRKGAKSVREVIRCCRLQNIKVLTLFALSVENFLYRPKTEIAALIDLLLNSIISNIKELQQNKVRLKVIGDLSVLPEKLIAEIQSAEQVTSIGSELELIIAVNYSGRWDILQAANRYAAECQRQGVMSDSVDVFSRFLTTSDYPDPDLLIRTGGDQRISNFLLWQCAYTEICFFEEYWPDFNEELFAKALSAFSRVQRNFGRTKAEGCHD